MAHIFGSMLIVIVRKRVEPPRVDARLVKQVTLYRARRPAVPVPKRVYADHIEMRRNRPHNWIPMRPLARVEPLYELPHKPPHIIARLRRHIAPHGYAIVAIPARFVVFIVDALRENGMKFPYEMLGQRVMRIAPQPPCHIQHKRLCVSRLLLFSPSCLRKRHFARRGCQYFINLRL